MSDALVRLFGWPATLFHGDTLVLDRWRWLKRRLPRTRGNERLIDVGCGTGAYTIGAARRGYRAVGLSWDERNQQVAEQRAAISRTGNVAFPIGDARRLDEFEEFRERFDVVICLETIEHIIDDRKLMIDMARCLKPGGRLYLTTPNHYYAAITPTDDGPFEEVETGGHVRRGYSPAMLRELCDAAGLTVEEVGHVSFFFSQMTTRALRQLKRPLGQRGAWACTLPLRILPIALDPWLGRVLGAAFGRPGYSITLSAWKPRHGGAAAG